MTTKVEKSILVNVPVGTAYNQWTQFEDFPQFMGGVKTVTQLDDRTLHWVAEIGGVKREWDATILEQVPDEKVAWAATSGATNAGAVYFEAVSTDQTSVRLSLEYEPEGLVEKVGDKLNIIEKQAESDLERFKAFIESEGYATGAWRGSVNEGAAVGTPGVEAAAASEGDSGKAGLSAKTVLATAAVAGAGVAAAAAAKRKSGDDTSTDEVEITYETQPVEMAPVETAPVVVEEVVDVVPAGDTSGARPGEVSASYAPIDRGATVGGTDMPARDVGAMGDSVAYRSKDAPNAPAETVAPVLGTPVLTGMVGTQGAAGTYAAADDAVTDLGTRTPNTDPLTDTDAPKDR